EYNALFAVPLVPFMVVLGDTRAVYELALSLVYFVPLAAAIGFIAVRITSARPMLTFWATTVLFVLTPMAWVPVLRGYPDAGAAFLIAVAMLAYLHDTRLEHVWQPLVIGSA